MILTTDMNSKKLLLPALIGLMICTFILHNGVLPANIMEARNLTTAREMVTENSWLKPTLNGDLRLEKPPLPTWITAVSMLMFGQDDLSTLRISSALAAMLLIFFLFRLTKELSGDHLIPWLAAGTASTSFYILFLARDISWDMFCHSFMLGAIWLLHKGLKNANLNYTLFFSSSVLMGLSFISKGPVAFYALLLPYLIALFLTRKSNQLVFHKKGIFTLILLTFIMSAVWPVYIYFTFHDYAVSVAVKESTYWITNNVRPIYHYWSFTAQSGIWVLPATISLFIPYLKKRTSPHENYLLIAIWTLAAVVLLSLIPEKKERYLFPVLIPLSITTAYYFRVLIKVFKEGNTDKWDKIFFKLYGILLIIISFLIPPVYVFLIRQGGHTPTFWITTLTFVAFWSIGIFFVTAFRQQKPLKLWLGMVLLVAACTSILAESVPELINKNSQYRSYTELRYKTELKGLPFFFSDVRDNKLIEVVWAIGRKIQCTDAKDIGKLPDMNEFVLLSPKEPVLIFSPEILSGYRIEKIGLFDANLQERWGGDVLRNYVTVFRKIRKD